MRKALVALALIFFLHTSHPMSGAWKHPNYLFSPRQLEERLQTERFEVIEAERSARGLAGSRKIKVGFVTDGLIVNLKWKTAPGNRNKNAYNNSPRKEVAAYEIQKLFLLPREYVVPPTAVRCLPLETVRQIDPSLNERDFFPDTKCVYGTLSYWLRNVTLPERHLDKRRFAQDRLYAGYLGNLNLLAYLIQHNDSRKGNFLISTDTDLPISFSVDNGIAFGSPALNTVLGVKQWAGIQVPALPAAKIARLRQLDLADLKQALSVVIELKAGPDGILKPVKRGAKLDPERATAVQPGYLQDGLSDEGIERVYRRLQKLLRKIDRGEIPAF